MGFLYKTAHEWFQNTNIHNQLSLTAEQIEDLIDARQQARMRKDFIEADRIRHHLVDNKIVIEDSPQSTQWRRV